MSDLFELRLRLDGESMTEFGGAVARLGMEFPAVILANVQELAALCAADSIDRQAVESVSARLAHNAQAGAQAGKAVATLIGMCQPVRIDGGPVQ
jgi:hypothetical protein